MHAEDEQTMTALASRHYGTQAIKRRENSDEGDAVNLLEEYIHLQDKMRSMLLAGNNSTSMGRKPARAKTAETTRLGSRSPAQPVGNSALTWPEKTVPAVMRASSSSSQTRSAHPVPLTRASSSSLQARSVPPTRASSSSWQTRSAHPVPPMKASSSSSQTRFSQPAPPAYEAGFFKVLVMIGLICFSVVMIVQQESFSKLQRLQLSQQLEPAYASVFVAGVEEDAEEAAKRARAGRNQSNLEHALDVLQLSHLAQPLQRHRMRYASMLRLARSPARWQELVQLSLGLDDDASERLRLCMLLLGKDSGFVDMLNLRAHWHILEQGDATTPAAFLARFDALRDLFRSHQVPAGDQAEYEDVHDELSSMARAGARGQGLGGTGREERGFGMGFAASS